jgi:RNA polymerase sigma-70 factor (ECF subfamily)
MLSGYRSGLTDSDEFVADVRAHQAVLARLVRRCTPEADADDVVQESLSAAWRSRHTFDPQRGSFRAWLLAIAMNECRRAARRRRRSEMVVAAMSGHVRHAFRVNDEAGGADPLGDAVERAIAGLSARQRLVVNLYYFVDLPVDEVARILGITPGTVKSSLADARGRLRELLDKEAADHGRR